MRAVAAGAAPGRRIRFGWLSNLVSGSPYSCSASPLDDFTRAMSRAPISSGGPGRRQACCAPALSQSPIGRRTSVTGRRWRRARRVRIEAGALPRSPDLPGSRQPGRGPGEEKAIWRGPGPEYSREKALFSGLVVIGVSGDLARAFSQLRRICRGAVVRSQGADVATRHVARSAVTGLSELAPPGGGAAAVMNLAGPGKRRPHWGTGEIGT